MKKFKNKNQERKLAQVEQVSRIKETGKKIVNQFKGEYVFLSNEYNVPVYYDGRIYLNAENAFQSSKAKDKKVKEQFCLLSPNQAKQLGSKIKPYDGWERDKTNIMYNIIKAKFTQNPYTKMLLLTTFNDELINGTQDDAFWGVVNGNGYNHLGKILMKVRDELGTYKEVYLDIKK